MKFGQLIEYNMRNIFLKISFTECGRETISRPFSKRSYVMSGSIFLKFIQFIFIPCQVEECQNVLKLSGRPFAFTSYKAFLKNKKKSGTSLLALFSALILKKNPSLAILLAEAFIKANKTIFGR